MSIVIAVHYPTKAKVDVFSYRDDLCGCIMLSCDKGSQEVSIYTTPEKAKAIAAIINEKETP